MPAICILGWCAQAWGRTGGGEHYTGDVPTSRDSGRADGDGSSELLFQLVTLVFRYPKVGVPLLAIGGIAYLVLRNQTPKAKTLAAFRAREAELRTAVSPEQVQGWVNTLQLKDPEFTLDPLLERTRQLFLAVQEAWFLRDLSKVRRFLSDATFQRFSVQLQLQALQGKRDALADMQCLGVQLIGVDQSDWFDTVQMRIQAQARDTDVAASLTEDQARRAAAQAPLEPFTEVWTFVRKPGTKTRIGEELFDGKCPNCGAPYRGGATNVCEFCQAVVNSGNYDWTLSEVTQGTEHLRHYATVDGLREARAVDPGLNLEIVEDRASLVFWKWIEAETLEAPVKLAKLATPQFIDKLQVELTQLQQRGRRKVFLDCAVGAVTVRLFREGDDGMDEAHVDVRWSARMGIGPKNQPVPPLPSVPQRWVFILGRKRGATTSLEHGMSTSRCLQCHGPLTDSLSVNCDYCGALLSDGARDWIVRDAHPYEAWNALLVQQTDAHAARRNLGDLEDLADAQERERLLYMMAALAAADGEVSAKEMQLLRMCSERWAVDFDRVRTAMSAGPQVFDRLIPKASAEGSRFLRQLVNLALIDGRIDPKERRLLESAAQHLQLTEELERILGPSRPASRV